MRQEEEIAWTEMRYYWEEKRDILKIEKKYWDRKLEVLNEKNPKVEWEEKGW